VILRRFAQALREQNWATIVIEFVLLVAGVFLGIQAANWNAERDSDRRSVVFTERLKSDLRIEAWNFEMLVGYYGQVRANARRTVDALTGVEPLSDEALLVAAFRATQYVDNTRQRATYDELTSTGELALIRDRALRKLAMDIYSMRDFDWFIDEGRNSPYRVAFRRMVPYRVQDALEAACGDHLVVPGDYAGIPTTLEYPCRVDLPAAEIAATATALRADPEIPALLNLRIMNIGTNIANLTFYQESMRESLRAVAKDAPAKAP
jgi:hypothetical protein